MTSAPDMTASIAPRSDQLNAEDLLTGPRTVTVAAVKQGTAEQPVDIVTEEFGTGRPYKPSKTMRRMIVAAWGTSTPDYVGRRMTLYRDPDITFGRDRVGGIRISHLSHIEKRLEIALTVTRGKRATFTVNPLTDALPAKASAGLSLAARGKWLDRMSQLLAASNCGDESDQLTIIGKLSGDESAQGSDALTDDQLKQVVNQLNAWDKAGELAAKVADLLDQAEIDAAQEAEKESES